MTASQLDERVRQYSTLHGYEFDLMQALGEGTDGRVWFVDDNSVIKAFHRLNNYRTELGCYQRLMEKGVTKIDGLSVPQLIEYSHELAIIYVDPKPWNIRFREEEEDDEI